MPEPYHIFGSDLVLGANGDLLMISGTTETQQRVMRRLFTNPGSYLWNLRYGAGLPAMVGQKANQTAIAGIIRSQIFQEQSVAPSPTPTVNVIADPSGSVTATVTYTDAITGQTTGFPLELNSSEV